MFLESLEPRLALASELLPIYSTYFGGSRNETVSDVAVDGEGNTYVIGTTQSANLAGESGPDSGTDRAFVAKFDPLGDVEYHTILGPTPKFNASGFAKSVGYAIDIGADGLPLVVYEELETGTVPLAAGGFTLLPGEPLLVVAKLSEEGTPIFEATAGVIPKPGVSMPHDFGNVHLASDAAGAAYVTYSAFRQTGGGGGVVDPYITKITANGGIEFMQQLFETAADVAVDSGKNIYIASSTNRDDLPTTLGAYQEDPDESIDRGLTEIWIAKLDPTASSLLGATYLGGSDNDTVTAIAADPKSPGRLYLVGTTRSEDFPLRNPIQNLPVPSPTTGVDTRKNAFATLIDLNVGPNQPVMPLIASTYLGGGREEYLSSIAIDYAGDVYVAGGANSANFPTTNPLQAEWTSGPLFNSTGQAIGVNALAQDLVLAKFNATLSTLQYSTYFGGSGHDFVPRIAVDTGGKLHVAATSAGEMFSDYPTTRVVTTADFPTKNATQGNFDGGDFDLTTNLATDAVIMQFMQRGALFTIGSHVTVGREFNDVVGQFTSARREASVGDFSATIDWGDGTQSAGEIKHPNADSSVFLVYGKHTYESAGSYPVVIEVGSEAEDEIAPIREFDLSRFDASQTGGSIAIDRTNPSRLFAAMSDERGSSVTGGANNGGIVVATSNDSGSTWSPRPFGNDRGPSQLLARGNPDALFDDHGNLFLAYNGVQGNNIVIALSTDGGITFDASRVFELSPPGSTPNPQAPQSVGSPKLAFSGSKNEIWVTFEDRGGNLIYAAGALVSGLGQVGTFALKAVTGSQADGDSDIAAGPDGTIAVIWDSFSQSGAQNGILASFDADGLGAAVFALPTVVNTTVTDQPLTTPAQQSPLGIGATLVWDTSNGPHRGRLHAAHVDRADDVGSGMGTNELTIFTTFSDNSGASWSEPRRVTIDTQFQSMFLPSIALDPRSGDVAVGWYGTHGLIGTTVTTADFYVATSSEGMRFSDAQRVTAAVSNALDPELGPGALALGYGEAPTMAFFNGRLFPIWTDNSEVDGQNFFSPHFDVVTTIVGVFRASEPQFAIRPLPIEVIVGVAFNGPVATFTHPHGGLRLEDFTGNVTIDWGDGNQSGGQVTQPGGPGTKFVVSGSHVFSETGAYPLWIQVFNESASEVALPVSNVNAQRGSQAEATIAIDPTNPDRVFAAGVHVNVAIPRGIPISVSDDGGVTWISKTIADGADGLPPSIGDPKAAFDQFGNLFLTYLTPDPDRDVVVLLSTNGGDDFTLLKRFTDIDKADQPSIAIGPGEGGVGATVWLTWERDSQAPFQIIMAAGAPVHGPGAVGGFAQYMVAPASADGHYRNFGDIAIGPNGQVLVAYTKGVSGSSATGPAEIIVHLDPDGLGPLPFGPGVLITDVKIGSFLPIPAQASRTIDSEGNLAWDRSNGAHHGRVYLVYTDSPAVGSADTNIFLRYSDNNGLNWSEPIQVHDDSALSQFLPSVAVDQTSGNIGVGWHTAIESSNVRTMFAATLSDDGGSTFRIAQLVSPGESDATHSTLDPGGKRFQYGDYTGLAFQGGVLQPIWADNSVELESLADPRRFDLASARVAVAEVNRRPLVVVPVDIEDVESFEFSTSVATFTDPNGATEASSYRATINWGDGKPPSMGIITRQSDGSFSVRGTHEYAKAGRYPISIVIKGQRTKGEGATTAVIANAPLDLTVHQGLRVVREDEFTKVIGTLIDLNRHSIASDFIVSIEWGDGHGSLAELQLQPGSGVDGAPNTFEILGTHTYFTERTFTINVSLLERATGETHAKQGELISGDPPLVVNPGEFLDIEALAGINTGDLVLVKFEVPDGIEVPLDTTVGEYIGTINWGDGQVDTNIRPFVTSEDVTVVGRHTYASPGEYFPYITLRDDSGGVFYAPLIAMVEPDVTPQTRVVGSGLVHNPVTDRFVGELTVTNVSQSDISGPLFVVIHGLPAGVSLESFTAVTGAGDPVLKINQSRLTAGASLPPIPLIFSNPGRVPINYTVQVFDGIKSEPLGGAGVVFEPNRGQANRAAEYIARGQGYTIGLAAGHASLVLNGSAAQAGAAAFIEMVGANTASTGRAIDRLPGVSNYFVGNVAITDVPHYGRVRYAEVYAGIDVEYYGREGLLEYDWIVQPGADPDAIAMRFRGVETLRLDPAGNLRFKTGAGELVQRAPEAYQFVGGQRVEVASTYELQADGSVGFVLGQFDPSITLVIDPVLVYSTYLGGSGIERALGVAVDAAGNTVVVGETGSTDFFTVNPFDSELNQPDTSPFSLSFDAFVSKFDPSGELIFSTYLGGGSPVPGVPGDTRPYSVAIDSSGRIWVGGETLSPDFPTTVVAPAVLPGWSGDQIDSPSGGFLTQLAPDGSSIVYSTVFKGPNPLFDIAVDGAGAVYGATNGFAFKLNPATNTAPYVRFLGNGAPKGLAVDELGQVYIAGFTNDPSFPTKNAIFPTLRTPPDPTGDATLRPTDGFVTKLFTDGRVAFSTFLGNSRSGSATDIALGPEGLIHVLGLTNSDDLLVPGAWQATRKGDFDGYLLRLANDGSEVLYGTYLGGSSRDEVNGVAVDGAGRVYIGGTTQSLDFPPTFRAHQPIHGGGSTEGFAMAFEPDGRTLKYLTYLGGSGSDEVSAVAVDSFGNASYVGSTTSTDLPTRGAAQTRLIGADAFITRLLAIDAGAIALHNSPFTVTEGSPFSGLVAFFESNGTETADQFSAVIDWGDGLSSTGTVTGNFLSGFQIHGTHLYSDVGAHDLYVTLRDSLGRIVTTTNTSTVAASLPAQVRYHVAIDTSSLAGVQGLLSLQFNPGAIPGSPDTQVRVSDLRLFGGALGNSNSVGGVTGSLGSLLTLQPNSALNRLMQGITLGTRIEFDLEFAGPGLSPSQLGAFADIFAFQLLSAAGASPLLDADASGSLLRIAVSPDGTTQVVASQPDVLAAAAGRVTVANAPLSLALAPFNVQEGLAFDRIVATFTNGNPLETAEAFIARIDWGDGSPPTAGVVTGTAGNFSVSGAHVYETVGSYSLAVTIVEPDGGETTVRGGKAIRAAVQFNSFSNGSFGALIGAPVNGDFNGDGILDVLVQGSTFAPTFAGPGIQILLGQGDGSFDLAGFVTTDQSPSQFAVADFNQDGKLDVAAALIVFGQSTVNLYWGNGNGTLQSAVPLTDLRNPGNLAAADFNRDGKIDLIYTESAAPSQNTASNSLRVALGRGNGTFDAPTATAIPFASHMVYAADIDGDTAPDAILASAVSGVGTALYSLRGAGNGAFGSAISFFAATGISRTLAIADFDGDGKSDVAHVDSANLRVFRSNGDGTFAQLTLRPSSNSASLAVGDFNRDGRPDVATGESEFGNDLGRVRIFLNQGAGVLGQGVGFEGISAPQSVLVGDYDNDGHLDLATSGASTVVSVLPGTGNGVFESAVRYAVGLSEPQNLLRPRQTLVRDVNGDGHPDVIFVMTDGRIVAELGGGDGTFQPVVSGNAGPSPFSPLLIDVNHDGLLDLVNVNSGTDSTNDVSGASVVLGAAGGIFPTTQTNLSVGARPEAVKLADLNADGRLDIVTANYSSSGGVSIFLANPDGTFQSAANLPTGANARSIAVGDFNEDLRIDLAVVNESGTVSVLLGNGNGGFGAAVNRAVGSSPQAVQTGDFNRDGHADLAIVNFSGGGRVLPGIGDGTFGTELVFATTGTGVREIAVSEFNGDLNLDIVVTQESGGLNVLLGNGNGAFQTAVAYVAGTTTNAVALGDFNGDGRPDIAATNFFSNNVSILLGNAGGSFQNAVHFATSGAGPRSVAVGDFNADGKLDLAVADQFNDTAILLGNGNGTLQRPLNYSTATSMGIGGFKPRAVAVGDLNGDGRADVVVTHEIGGVSLLYGKGNGTFPNRLFTYIPPTSQGAGTSRPEDVAAADLNGDGHVDLAVSMNGATAILLGNGSGSFQFSSQLIPQAATGLGSTSNRVELADMDGDGDQDLVTLHIKSGGGGVAVWRNNGSGTFATPLVRDVPMPDYFRGVDMTIGDLNGDNRSDVVISDVGSGNLALPGGVSILSGIGDGSLAQPLRLLTAARQRPYQVLLADQNQDGRPEIVTLTSPNGVEGEARSGVGIFTNNGDGTFGAARFFDHGGNAAGFAAAGDFNGDGGEDIVVPHRQNLGSSFSIIFAGEQSILVTDAPVTVTGVSLNPRIGVAFTATVATFVDDNPFSTAGEFSATINWGDGQASSGTVQVHPLGGFLVVGSHTYASTGVFTTTVTVVAVTVVELGEGTHLGSATARVSASDQPLTATGLALTAMAEISFNGVVATFTDADSNGSIGDFSATIAWGDGATSAGVISALANGSFRVSGTHTYANPGTLPVQVTISDIGGSNAVANSTVQVAQRANQRPVAVNDAYSASEDATLIVTAAQGLLSNDTDVDNNTLIAAIIAIPAHGVVTVAADGSFQYRAAPNFFGDDQFTYEARDGSASSNIATVRITVTPVLDAPLASDDSAITNEDSPTIVNLLANDSAGDGALLPATVALTSLPIHGTVQINPITGAITYSPFPNYFGQDRFGYKVSDANGLLSGEATVSITTNAMNDAPVAKNNAYVANEDVPLIVASAQGVLANDADSDGGPLSTRIVTTTVHGSLTLHADGSFSYVPAEDFSGSDSFRYRAFDGLLESSTVTVYLLVQPVNDAPVVPSLANRSIDEGSPFIGSGAFTDRDLDDTWTASVDYGDGAGFQPLALAGKAFSLAHDYRDSGLYVVQVRVTDQGGKTGAASFQNTVRNLAPSVQAGADLAASEGATVELNATFTDPGAIDTHTAFINWGDGGAIEPVQIHESAGSCILSAKHVYADEGGYSVTVTVVDDEGATNSDTLIVSISNVAPFVYAGNDLTIDAGQSVTLPTLLTSQIVDYAFRAFLQQTVAGSFLDPGARDSHTATVDWGDGTIETIPLDAHTFGPQSAPLGVSGAVRGSHAYRSAGNFRILLTVADNDGGAGSHSILVTVNAAANQAPIAANDQVLAQKNTSFPISVLANDSDPDGTLNLGSIVIVGPASHGTTSINTATGVVIYTPAGNYTGPDSFTYKVKDNAGEDSNVATVTIIVNAPPIATNDQVLTQKNVSVAINVLANDSDHDGTLNLGSVIIVGAASHGTTSVNAVTGVVTYTPASNYTGADSFTYKVNDNTGAYSNLATVTITVNAPPIAVNDQVLTQKNTSLAISVLANDSDTDGALNLGSVIVVAAASHGTTSVNAATGVVTYTPAANYIGPDSFTYKVKDNTGVYSNIATVAIKVNAPPIATSDQAQTEKNKAVAINVLANDSDSDGTINLSSVVLVGAASHGSTCVNATTGVVTYTPTANYIGSDSFTYKVKDNTGAYSNVATVSIAIKAPPVITIIAVGADAGSQSKAVVKVYGADGKLKEKFLAYDTRNYHGGVRVAVADVNRDGFPDVITVPGRGHSPLVQVFDGRTLVDSTLGNAKKLYSFLAYDAKFVGGVYVAAGNVLGDSAPDIVVSPEREGAGVRGPANGGAEIRVFQNRIAASPNTPFKSAPDRKFLAFAPDTVGGAKFIGGATIALADMNRDGKGEIIVGNGSGMGSTIRVFDVQVAASSYRPIKTYTALAPGFRGGIFVAAGDVNGDGIADIVVGAGQGGGSKAEVLNGKTGALLYRIAPPNCPEQAAVRVAVKDTNGDGVVDAIFLGQSTDGRNNKIRRNKPMSTTAVDFLMETDRDLGGGVFLG